MFVMLGVAETTQVRVVFVPACADTSLELTITEGASGNRKKTCLCELKK